jgi:hypothetical protein
VECEVRVDTELRCFAGEWQDLDGREDDHDRLDPVIESAVVVEGEDILISVSIFENESTQTHHLNLDS